MGILAYQGLLPLKKSGLPVFSIWEQLCSVCFSGGVDCFYHKLSPTNLKPHLSSETSASLRLIRRVRQKVQIEISVNEVGSASKLICAKKLTVSFSCGRLI